MEPQDSNTEITLPPVMPCPYLRFEPRTGLVKCSERCDAHRKPPQSVAKMEMCTYNYYDFRLCPEANRLDIDFDKVKVLTYIRNILQEGIESHETV